MLKNVMISMQRPARPEGRFFVVPFITKIGTQGKWNNAHVDIEHRRC